LNQARAGHTATLLANGKVLIAGGKDASGQALATAEIYDPATRVYTRIPANLPTPVWGYTATLVKDGKVVLVGGNGGSGQPVPDVQLFDPSTSKFMALSAMQTARSQHTAMPLGDGRVLIAGGTDGAGVLGDLANYDPVTRTFSPAPSSLLEPRESHTATLLPDGRVLIVGGADASGALNSAELYDPQDSTVTAAGSLTVARTLASAALLPDGTVLVAGGQDPHNPDPHQQDLDSAEAYDPSTNTFTLLSSQMTIARSGHVGLALLYNGKVLIAGGSNAGQLVSTTEVYDPVRGEFWAVESPGTARQLFGTNFFAVPSTGLLLASGGLDSTHNPLASSEFFFFPTLRSDKSDYPPGSTVTLTGEGWSPNEAITLMIHESSGDPDTLLSALADAAGAFTNKAFQTAADRSDAGVTFLATATGQNSRWTAQTTFTDAASDGDGTMTVNPTSVTVGSSGNSFTFTFTSSANGNMNGGQVTVDIPAGWTPPQVAIASSPGFISVTAGTCSSALLNSITGTGPWTIAININCTTNKTFTMTYAGGGTKVTAPTTVGSSTFTTKTKVSGGTLTNIADSPTVTVTKANTTTALMSSANPSGVGQSVTFTAAVRAVGSGTPTGTVTFTDGTTTLGTGTLNGGQATFTTTSLSAGSHSIIASYGGDNKFNTSTAAALSQTVNKANQTITLTGAPASAVYNTSFAVSAAASSGLPVTITASGVCAVSGTTMTMTSGTGACTLTASQGGDANYNAAPNVTQTTAAAKANQTITFGALANRAYGSAPVTVSATASSGLAVSFSMLSGPATISGNTVTITGAGTVVVRASQSTFESHVRGPMIFS
jgi:Bacterial Ig-like domain (group 3)/Galactose oxidase, central domain/Kelch motif